MLVVLAVVLKLISLHFGFPCFVFLGGFILIFALSVLWFMIFGFFDAGRFLINWMAHWTIDKFCFFLV